jgi:hypothetical protein
MRTVAVRVEVRASQVALEKTVAVSQQPPLALLPPSKDQGSSPLPLRGFTLVAASNRIFETRRQFHQKIP